LFVYLFVAYSPDIKVFFMFLCPSKLWRCFA
jgi:hypothetical protein